MVNPTPLSKFVIAKSGNLQHWNVPDQEYKRIGKSSQQPSRSNVLPSISSSIILDSIFPIFPLITCTFVCDQTYLTLFPCKLQPFTYRPSRLRRPGNPIHGSRSYNATVTAWKKRIFGRKLNKFKIEFECDHWHINEKVQIRKLQANAYKQNPAW